MKFLMGSGNKWFSTLFLENNRPYSLTSMFSRSTEKIKMNEMTYCKNEKLIVSVSRGLQMYTMSKKERMQRGERTKEF